MNTNENKKSFTREEHNSTFRLIYEGERLFHLRGPLSAAPELMSDEKWCKTDGPTTFQLSSELFTRSCKYQFPRPNLECFMISLVGQVSIGGNNLKHSSISIQSYPKNVVT